MLWRAAPAREWQTTVVVAGGESLTAGAARLIGMARARGHIRVIAVNDAIYPCWVADIAYACDARWWQAHGGLPGYLGLKLKLMVPSATTGEDICPLPYSDVHHMVFTGAAGFDPDTGSLRSGDNGGYQAIHLAAHKGAKKIIVVAIDNQGPHFFGHHPHVQPGPGPNPKKFESRAAHFAWLASHLMSAGIDVVNVSPGSSLTAFRRGDLKSELQLDGVA